MSKIQIFIIIFLGILLILFTRPDRLPSMELQVHHQGEVSNLKREVGGACQNEWCLTVYLSPSCPTSPKLTSMLIALTADLQSDGIKTDIIIGNDPEKSVNYFAKRYPFDVLLDARGIFYSKAKLEYTPTFIVTNDSGEIVSLQNYGYYDPSYMRNKLGI